MRYDAFRLHRIKELLCEDRCFGGDDENHKGLNRIKGLVDLVMQVKPSSVLEIGSHRGVSTEVFLLFCHKVVALDSWEGQQWAPWLHDFMDRVSAYPQLEVLRGRSPDALTNFADHEFDLVYIDGAHDYEAVKRDIEAAKRLTRRWLAGHDHTPASDVAIAVKELLGEPKVFDDTSWLIEVN